MVNHGLSTGALFLLVGMLYDRRHTRLIAEYGGLWRQMPIFAVFFLVVMFSSIGLPGLNGFVGEFLILLGTFEYNRLFAVLAASGDYSRGGLHAMDVSADDVRRDHARGKSPPDAISRGAKLPCLCRWC